MFQPTLPPSDGVAAVALAVAVPVPVSVVLLVFAAAEGAAVRLLQVLLVVPVMQVVVQYLPSKGVCLLALLLLVPLLVVVPAVSLLQGRIVKTSLGHAAVSVAVSKQLWIDGSARGAGDLSLPCCLEGHAISHADGCLVEAGAQSVQSED